MSHSLDHYSTDYQHGSKGVEVFVGGLARSLTEDKVYKVFSACGEIIDMRLIKDQAGILKGFGFIRFATKDAADKALKDLNESTLEGKKIGVLPSAGHDTLFLGNLNKGWSTDDFHMAVRQVFPDVVSVDLAQPRSDSETDFSKKIKNRGFGFVKFSSHGAAARALKVGSRPDFVLGGTLHPSVKWAEEDAGADPDELAKIKIAFVKSLPSNTDEKYLKLLFGPFGEVEKVVVHKKGASTVGFVHFSQRSYLDNAIRGLNEKVVKGPMGSPSFKILVEVARPMDKKRKRVFEDSQVTQSREVFNNYKPQKYDSVLSSFNGHHEDAFQKESGGADPYEDAVLLLPVVVRERLLRILRLGIATRYDIEVESLADLAKLPESTAILVLDQFMLSGAEKHDKGAYLTSLISKYQVDKLGSSHLPLGLSRSRDSNVGGPVAHLSAVDSLALHDDPSVPRSDSYASRYSSLYSDYRLGSHAGGVLRPEERSPLEVPHSSYSRYLQTAYGNMEEMSPNPSHEIPGTSSLPYPKPAQDPYRTMPPSASLAYTKPDDHAHPSLASYAGKADDHAPPSGDAPPTRPQLRFDPFTGQPYKFDPFTGEPIVPENLPSPYENPFRL